jgi:hypothetical protein
LKDTILESITRYYLDSGDFNGTSAASLVDEFGVEWNELHDVLRELIEEDVIGIVYADEDPNTHILRVGFSPQEVQIAKLATDELYHTCIYPRPKHLEQAVDRARYEREPYKLSLALGEPQLNYCSFDLSVLEFYRNDPRYLYENNDIDGYISIQNPAGLPEHDQVLLKTFGFSYDGDFNRAVAVFLRYLACLSPEHQRIWQVKQLAGDYKLHSDYFQYSYLGDWGEGVSIFTAFLAELRLINQMAEAMGRPALLRETFSEEEGKRPARFTFLVRPTLEEFNAFIMLLDQMLSDNINKRFFQGEVPEETEITRNDGRIEVRQKGTLQILDDWVRLRCRLPDWKPWDDAIAALRKVRRLRQRPAHAVNENVFDQQYFKEQRQLMIEVYDAVNVLRQLLGKHRAVRAAGIAAPDWLQDGKIWTQ